MVGGELDFVVSHPFDGKKSKGWGTVRLLLVGGKTKMHSSFPASLERFASLQFTGIVIG